MDQDKSEEIKKNQINLIDYLNKKSGKEQQNNTEGLDSSLENNLSNNSDDEDHNSSNNNYIEFNFDPSQNQNTKIHRNQCMKDNKSSKKQKSTQDKYSNLQSKNKQKTNSNNQSTGMNSQSSFDRNTFKNNIFNNDEDEEEETKNQAEQPKSKKNNLSFLDSNEDKEDFEFNEDNNQQQNQQEEGEREEDGYQTIGDEDEDVRQNQGSNNEGNSNFNNSRSNSEISNEIGGQQNQRRQHRNFGQSNDILPLQSLFPDISQILAGSSSLTSNQQGTRMMFPSQLGVHHPMFLTNIRNLDARNSRSRRQISQNRQRPNREQYSDVINNYSQQNLEIQPTESVENQVKHMNCALISSILIFGVLYYFLKNQSKVIKILICLIFLFIILIICVKRSKLLKSRSTQIHENSQFSYVLSNRHNRQNEDDNYILPDRFSRMLSSQHRGTSQVQRQLRNFRNMMIFQTLFSILNQIQQTTNEVGYNEQQLIQIGGTQKYSELKRQKKQEQNKNQDDDPDLSNQEEDDSQCIVCLDTFSDDNDVRILKCQHYFHQNCVDEWLKKKKECPVCRQCPLIVEAIVEDPFPNPDNQSHPFNSRLFGPQFVYQFGAPSQGLQSQIRRPNNRRSNMNVILYY